MARIRVVWCRMNELTMNKTASTPTSNPAKPTLMVRGFELLKDLKWIGRVVLSSCDRFYWDNGFSKAASLAYSSLVSLVPLTALWFGVLAVFLQTGDRMEAVQQFLFQNCSFIHSVLIDHGHGFLQCFFEGFPFLISEHII